jgi:hypothetical protein
LVAIGYATVHFLTRPPAASAGPAPSAEIVYLCRETGVLTRGPRRPTPAVNEATGRNTLVQALYCPECREWHPAPPSGFSERMPVGPVCPRHQRALQETGPLDPRASNSVQ